jgi:hypothetical protein
LGDLEVYETLLDHLPMIGPDLKTGPGDTARLTHTLLQLDHHPLVTPLPQCTKMHTTGMMIVVIARAGGIPVVEDTRTRMSPQEGSEFERVVIHDKHVMPALIANPFGTSTSNMAAELRNILLVLTMLTKMFVVDRTLGFLTPAFRTLAPLMYGYQTHASRILDLRILEFLTLESQIHALRTHAFLTLDLLILVLWIHGLLENVILRLTGKSSVK